MLIKCAQGLVCSLIFTLLGKQIAQWSISNKLKHCTIKNTKIHKSFKQKKEEWQYIPLKVVWKEFNAISDKSRNDIQNPINESEWKFTHKAIKRTQRNTLFYKVTKNAETKKSLSWLLENEYIKKSIDCGYNLL